MEKENNNKIFIKIEKNKFIKKLEKKFKLYHYIKNLMKKKQEPFNYKET